MCFCLSLGQFIPVFLAFVVLGLVSSIPSREIGWEERVWNDLFCVEWDVKPELSQSIDSTRSTIKPLSQRLIWVIELNHCRSTWPVPSRLFDIDTINLSVLDAGRSLRQRRRSFCTRSTKSLDLLQWTVGWQQRRRILMVKAEVIATVKGKRKILHGGREEEKGKEGRGGGRAHQNDKLQREI